MSDPNDSQSRSEGSSPSTGGSSPFSNPTPTAPGATPPAAAPTQPGTNGKQSGGPDSAPVAPRPVGRRPVDEVPTAAPSSAVAAPTPPSPGTTTQVVSVPPAPPHAEVANGPQVHAPAPMGAPSAHLGSDSHAVVDLADVPPLNPGDFATRFQTLTRNMGTVIQGKPEVLHLAAVCLLAEGHLLLEDVPGTGKTSLARAIAGSVQMTWNRIQFTPDLLPSDVTGVSVFNQAQMAFEFRPGPVFANIVVGDEINRASPKTQSAMLEVMEERTVTNDGAVYVVPRPFMVVATQNPIDMEGTYRLPEAQLDRFLMRLSLGYPSYEAEIAVLRTQRQGASVDAIHPVMSHVDLAVMVEQVKQVEVAPSIDEYIVSLAAHTRTLPDARLGVSPRGSLALMRAARAAAASVGRAFVTPEDIKSLAAPVWSHRIVVTPEAELGGRSGADVVARALEAIPVPRTLATV